MRYNRRGSNRRIPAEVPGFRNILLSTQRGSITQDRYGRVANYAPVELDMEPLIGYGGNRDENQGRMDLDPSRGEKRDRIYDPGSMDPMGEGPNPVRFQPDPGAFDAYPDSKRQQEEQYLPPELLDRQFYKPYVEPIPLQPSKDKKKGGMSSKRDIDRFEQIDDKYYQPPTWKDAAFEGALLAGTVAAPEVAGLVWAGRAAKAARAAAGVGEAAAVARNAGRVATEIEMLGLPAAGFEAPGVGAAMESRAMSDLMGRSLTRGELAAIESDVEFNRLFAAREAANIRAPMPYDEIVPYVRQPTLPPMVNPRVAQAGIMAGGVAGGMGLGAGYDAAHEAYIGGTPIPGAVGTAAKNAIVDYVGDAASGAMKSYGVPDMIADGVTGYGVDAIKSYGASEEDDLPPLIPDHIYHKRSREELEEGFPDPVYNDKRPRIADVTIRQPRRYPAMMDYQDMIVPNVASHQRANVSKVYTTRGRIKKRKRRHLVNTGRRVKFSLRKSRKSYFPKRHYR